MNSVYDYDYKLPKHLEVGDEIFCMWKDTNALGVSRLKVRTYYKVEQVKGDDLKLEGIEGYFDCCIFTSPIGYIHYRTRKET